MTCYGVDTAPVKKMSEALERLDIDLLDLRPNKFRSQARRRRKEFSKLVDLYLDMAFCFFAVMRAVAARALVLERQAVSRGTRKRQVVDRGYLEGFLPIYDRASERSLRHLRGLFKAAFAGDAQLQAAFVSRMVESGMVAEVRQYTEHEILIFLYFKFSDVSIDPQTYGVNLSIHFTVRPSQDVQS